MKKLNKILKDSSLPGIPRMLENDHFIIKFFWIICLIGLTGLSVYYLIINVISYLSYSFVTNIAVISETTPQFPAISFCITSGIQIPTPQNSLYSCTFDSKQCTFEDFEISTVNLVNVNYFETCLRFNSGRNYSNQSTQIKTISRTSIYTGLNLTFLLDDFIIDSFLSTTIYKLRISIDNYTSRFNQIKVYDSKLGIDIPLGNTQIKIEREYYQKLSKPYNDCIKQNTKEYVSDLFQYFKQINKTYLQTDCIDECIRKKMEYNCTNKSSSFLMNEIDCYTDLFYKYRLKKIKFPQECYDKCPLECDINDFKIEQTYMGKMKDDRSLNISIYFKTLDYLFIKQIKKSNPVDLISNIGSILGLFIGLNFFNFIELFQIIVSLIIDR